MRDTIEGPGVQPPLYGLIVAAPTVTDGGGRWQLGFVFEREHCGAGTGRVPIELCGALGAMNTPEFGGRRVEGDPFAVFAADRCFPLPGRDYEGRARRQLEATQSFQVAEELWLGTLRDAHGLTNRALVDDSSDTLTAGAATVAEAVACLEQGLARCLRGRRGMIHVTPQVLTVMMGEQLATRNGQLIVTGLGTIVVADAGYDGTGPGGVAPGASQWIYATSMLQVLLGAVEVVPGNLDNDAAMAQALDRDTNLVTVYAYRPAAVQWDECCHLAAEVDLAACAIGGAA